MNIVIIPRIESIKSLCMPEWSGISTWTRSLGRVGIDWYPGVTLYNTGRNLFCVEKHPPFLRYNEASLWTWLKYSEHGPQSERSWCSNIPCSFRMFIHYGHSKNRDVMMGISIKAAVKTEPKIVILKPIHLFHVVYNKSGVPLTAIESRPLPLKTFDQALWR